MVVQISFIEGVDDLPVREARWQVTLSKPN
jgi:hypothetical protein